MTPAVDFRPPARFRVLRRVGAGGMGVVYEAIDESSGSRVALKTLVAVEPGRVLAFKDEFRSLAGFSHPNVATLYELLSSDDRWFIAMEFIEGVSFLDYLCGGQSGKGLVTESRASAPLDATITLHGEIASAATRTGHRRVITASPPQLREVAWQLAEAVAALHEAGILHRDLKPSNVMITPEGHLYVLDFGLAERLDRRGEATRLSSVSGTVPYMAPEQAAGEALSPAADWYAVGAMLYEAIAGQCPFEGPAKNVLWEKQKSDPPPLEDNVVQRDPELAELCMELVRRDPARRPQGAEVTARLSGPAASRYGVASRVSSLNSSSLKFSTTAGRPVFVGRESQLAALKSAFDDTGRGATKVALIVGKSGMGKSALVGQFLAGLDGDTNPLVLAGRCYEKESVPFKAFDSIVDSLARYLEQRTTAEVNRVLPRGVSALSQVFPVLNQVPAIGSAIQRNPAQDALELRQRAFGALREMLIRLGDLRRLVVYIDDVQWGDGDSAALLRHILQQPDAPEMLLIAACREEYAERGDLLAALVSQPGCLRVPVGPLTPVEACRLATDLHGADHEKATQIARESGGSPYFVQELHESAGTGEAGLASLDAVLYRRVATLPADAKQLVEIAAVSGRPLMEGDACRAAGLFGEDQRMLAMLRAQRLIRGASGQIEIFHDRVREAVVAHLDGATLQRHHFALATTLESSEADAEAIAGHFASAGETARAAPHYVRAAERASGALAFDRAADLLSRAVAFSTDAGEGKRRLRVKLAQALGNAGRGFEAARAFGESAIDAPLAEAIEMQRSQAYWYTVSGYMDEGAEAFRHVSRLVGIRVPPRGFLPLAILWMEIRLRFGGLKFRPKPVSAISRAEVNRLDVAWDAARGFSMIDMPTGFYFTELALMIALRAGHEARIALAWNARLPIIWGMRGLPVPRHAEDLAAKGAELSRRVGIPYVEAFFHFATGLRNTCHGRWREALGHLETGIRMFREECAGFPWELASCQDFYLLCLIMTGRLEEHRRLTEDLDQDFRARGNKLRTTLIETLNIPFCLMVAGRPAEALRRVEAALAGWTASGYFRHNCEAALTRAEIYLYLGQAREAWNAMNAEWPLLTKHTYTRVPGLYQRIFLARARCALALACETAGDERKRMLKLVRKDAEWLRRDIAAYAHAFAEILLAGCAALEGKTQEATSLIESSIAGFESHGMSMIAATARWRLGQIGGGERGAGLRDEAAAAMRVEGVCEPERLVALYAPGFAASTFVRSG